MPLLWDYWQSFGNGLIGTIPPLDKKNVAAVLVIWLMLAVPALFAMLSLKRQPHATLGTELEGFDGKKMILLEPETWIGKEFPLFLRFAQSDGIEVLQQGTWNVLLIHTDCPDCKKMMAGLEEKKPENVAIVVIPSRPNETMPDTSFPIFRLDTQNGWFISTPSVVKLTDGICVATGESVIE